MRQRDPDRSPAWLIARPIAHRGLHKISEGVVENSIAAAKAAMDRDFAVECDVQCTADGDAVVFHDFTLDRLTGETGSIAGLPSRSVVGLRLKDSDERIPSFAAYLDRIGGRVPLICEIKSAFDGDMRLADRIAALVLDYCGPVAIKSFDPAVVTHLRRRGFDRPLGMISEASFEDPEWNALSTALRKSLANVLHFAETRPDFLSYHVDDLPHAVPYLCGAVLGLPVMAWTVRTAEQRRRAASWADQMVFEGFVP